ncbi:hypothetical protein FRC02_011139 [Tulasnella sp. 418]|nr:hypothetical protein FRC02_011139 [Tulasnella sp. 418]
MHYGNRGRGRGRGQRGGGGGGFANRREDPPIPLETLLKGLGTLAATIEKPEMNESEMVEMSDFKAVASYNWIEGKGPCILVPGSPPIWNNPVFPLKLQSDTDPAFIDQNGYRCPEWPLLPLIKAVQHIEPDFDFSSIDILTDRNNLRKLMRWLSGESKEFRIDLERVGDCLVLKRWEVLTQEVPQPGYGHVFELASTDIAPGCVGTTGHHRIVSYEFDGLRFLVRCQVDACIRSTENSEVAKPTKDATEDDLFDLAGLSLSKKSDASDDTVETSGEIKITPSSNPLVPQSTMMELKTRSVRNAATFNWDDTWPQLYLSHTKHLYLAIHQSGTFQELRKLDLDNPTPEMATAAQKSQKLLRGLVDALKKVSALTWSQNVGQQCSLVYHDKTMSLYTRDSHVLPPEARELFE